MDELLFCIKKMESQRGLVSQHGYDWYYEHPPARIVVDASRQDLGRTRQQKLRTREWLSEIHAYFSTLIRESRSHHTGGGGFALNQLMQNSAYHNHQWKTCCGFRRVVMLCRQIVEAMGMAPLDIEERRFKIPSKW